VFGLDDQSRIEVRPIKVLKVLMVRFHTIKYPGMSNVDVISEIRIQLPAAQVADFAADPDNATRWYENINLLNGI